MAAPVKSKALDESLHLNNSEVFPSLAPQKSNPRATPTYGSYAKALVEGKQEATPKALSEKNVSDLSSSEVSEEDMRRLFASTCATNETDPDVVTTTQLLAQVIVVEARIQACGMKIEELNKKAEHALKYNDLHEVKKIVKAYNVNANFYIDSISQSEEILAQSNEMLSKTEHKDVNKSVFAIFARAFGIKAETFEENVLKLREQRSSLMTSMATLKTKMQEYKTSIDKLYWVVQNADLALYKKDHSAAEIYQVEAQKPVASSTWKSIKGIIFTQVPYTIGQQYTSVN